MGNKYNDIYQPITEDALSRIPAAMKAAARWVVWGGKKVPVNGNCKNQEGHFTGADVKDPATWLTFDAACQLISKPCKVRGEYSHIAGIGFVVGDGWFCVDGDGGADHGREPLPEAVIFDLCARSRSYAEMSISKNGCHLFGRCDFLTEEGKESFSASRSSFEIEFFTRRQFIVVTGDRVPGSAEDAVECSADARQIYNDYVLTGCNHREAEERRQREEYRSSITIDPNDSEQFFLLNYPRILKYADVDNFKRKPGSGEYSWIGAIKAMDEIDVPRSAIYEWCRRGKSFAGENDIDKVLNEKRSSSSKSTTAAIVMDAISNDMPKDGLILTGEYKKAFEEKEKREAEERQISEKYRERRKEMLAAVGVDGDPERFTWTYDFDGNIQDVIEKETGEYVYRKPADVIQGITVHEATTLIPSTVKKKPLIVTGYEDVVEEETEFLYFPWFPRKMLVTIQGDSGSSKSTFMYAVGAKVTKGEDLLGVPCENPGNVMFITNEDSDSDILTAFLDAGGDRSHLFRIADREQTASLDLSADNVELINNMIKEYNIKLLVLDPIQAFLRGDMNKASETRPQLVRLMNIAAENNNTIVYIQHMGKDRSKEALHRGIGSVDIGAATRSVLQIVTDPEDDYYKIAFTVKNNLAAIQDYRRAIRYQVKDHPGSYDPTTKKHHHFHGHAEFIKLMPEYNDRIFRKAQQKADEEERAAIEYPSDPLVLTVRELAKYNPSGLFIGADDLIARITEHCGHCPYTAGTKSKTTGLNSRIDDIRETMMKQDAIQMDVQSNSIAAKPYNWKGTVINPASSPRVKGVNITPIKNSSEGGQQIEF